MPRKKTESTKKPASNKKPAAQKAVGRDVNNAGNPIGGDTQLNIASPTTDEATIEGYLNEQPIPDGVPDEIKQVVKPTVESVTSFEGTPKVPLIPVDITNQHQPQEPKLPSFMEEITDSSGELTFSNRTHFELIFNDLGYESKDGKFDPLIFKPYETKDLEMEGFERKDVVKSKNLRNFIHAAKIKHGKLAQDSDKLPDTTLFGSVRRNGDITKGQQSIPWHDTYSTAWETFIAKEKRLYDRSKVD